MKRISTYLFSVTLIAVTALSCKDESLVTLPVWETGVHGFGVLTSDPAVGFNRDDSAITVDVDFRWNSIDKQNTVTNIDLFVVFNEAYVDIDGNNAIASHGGSAGIKLKSVSPQGNREVGSFSISQEEVYAIYQSATFDYGFGNGAQPIYSDPLGKGRSSAKKFVPGDSFTLKWALTTDDGRVFDSWSPSACTEFPGANCQLDWAVSCATDIQNRTGTWTISGTDSYGDGWNGASIDVVLDGEVVDSFTVAESANSEDFVIPAGSSDLYFVYNKGDWDSEVGVTIKNPAGATLLTWVPADVKGQGEMLLDLCLE